MAMDVPYILPKTLAAARLQAPPLPPIWMDVLKRPNGLPFDSLCRRVSMRFELVVGLLSSFQIYHQSLSNCLAMLDFGYTTHQLSVISATFPVGKFLGTVSVAWLFRKGYSTRQCLDYAAGLLIIGASTMLLSTFFALCVGRLMIGFSVGISFIAAFIALADFSNYSFAGVSDAADSIVHRKQRCSSAFFGVATFFAAAVFFANLSALFRTLTHFAQICVFSFPAILSGLNYFWHRNTLDEDATDAAISESASASLPLRPTAPSSYFASSSLGNGVTASNVIPTYQPQQATTSDYHNPFHHHHQQIPDVTSCQSNAPPPSVNWGPESRVSGAEEMVPKQSSSGDSYRLSPFITAILLMSINATIGVPIVLAFSSVIYRSLGMSQRGAVRLSAIYPLIQIFVMLTFRRWSSATGGGDGDGRSTYGTFFSNRLIVLVGYAICLVATLLLLLTIGMSTLDTNPTAKHFFSWFWFTILAVATAPPGNAGITIITNELFTKREALIEGMVYSRAFFWIVSSLLSAIFLRMLLAGSLMFGLLPCFCASLVSYCLLFSTLSRSDSPPLSPPSAAVNSLPKMNCFTAPQHRGSLSIFRQSSSGLY